MSLNWDMSKVQDFKDLHESDEEWVISESIIFSSMVIGLRNITEDNVDEWEWRLAIYQNLNGAWMRKKGKPYYILRKHIERRVGLSTNASEKKRKEWIDYTLKTSLRDVIATQVESNSENDQ